MDEPNAPQTAPAPRRRIRLVWALLAVLLATALVPLFITAYALIDISRENLESATREYQLQVATSLASRLDTAITDGRSHVEAVVNGIGTLVSRAGSAPAGDVVRALLAPHVSKDLVLLRYTSAAGTMTQVGEPAGLDIETVRRAYFEGFATAMEGGSASEIPIQISEGKEFHGPSPGVIISVPVAASGKAAGVVSALIDLTETWRRGLNDVGADYAVFALDPDGGMLAAESLPADLADGSYRKLEIVQRFLTSSVKFKETMPVTLPGPQAKELLGASAPTDVGWGLFVVLDRALAYHAADEMRREVYRWAIFAVALAVAAAVVAAGLVTRPLGALVEGARRLSRGEFGTPVKVRSRSEIGELAETFNLMSEEIQNHIQRLNDAAEENQQLFLGTIRALAAAIDEKDPYTRGHSERVHRYAMAIGRHMRLQQSDIRGIMVSALLHDVGKIGIEDAILRKPEALTDKEFEVMKRHPEKGAHIMAPIPQMRSIIGGIRNHHERWTGGGYPDNLRGEDIPLFARVVQVADTFDAMTTNRPYQRAMKFEAAVARIRELSGIVFDPKVVDAFQEAWVAGDIREPRPAARVAEVPVRGTAS